MALTYGRASSFEFRPAIGFLFFLPFFFLPFFCFSAAILFL